ncbi:hypothetical protein BASA81_001999 [Batrachochytrium salamandrivorans]|nr:hypothetical protein BASA81_001999 [Batrachochytrium salamandrivorans]
MLFLALLVAMGLASSSPCGGGGTMPSSPIFPTTQYPSSPPSFTVVNHWSEIAQMPRPTLVLPTSNEPQTDCPHKTGTFVHFHNLGFVANGNPITLPVNTRVLVSTCSLPDSGVFGRITIPATSELVFNDDGPILLNTKGIFVQGGKLLLGRSTCRLRNKITMTFHGTRADGQGDTKGIIATNAQVEMHGQRFRPTWTRLANTIEPGSSVLFVQDRVNWQIGMRLVVTTTELKDGRDYHENEEREIAGVFTTAHPNVTAITVTQPFTYKHFAGKAYQAEVALLSRTILLQGNLADSMPTDTAEPIACTRANDGDSTYPCTDKFRTGYGFHVRIEGSNTVAAKFSGIEWIRSGQTNTLARYSLHFHMLGQTITLGILYAKDCSVHDAYFRAYAIHGTNRVVLEENVAFNVIGHAYFLEDGVEEENTLWYNFGAFVHWLGDTTQNQEDSYYSQYLFWVSEQTNLILPSDSAATVFYITNAYNSFLGNAASGGWAGYGFVNLPKPVKMHINYGNGQYTPESRPLLLFKGNTAHSTGYWFGSAGGVYVGGTLQHDVNGVLTYTAGRDGDRDTCAQDPTLTWGYCRPNDYRFMVFEDTKVFLASRGMQQWGRRSEVIRAETHDVGESMNVFGQVYLTQMLVQCRTLGQHAPHNFCASGSCASRDRAFFQSFNGFSWYDVYQNHIMTKTEFRNCNPKQVPCPLRYKPDCSGSRIFTMLTHSNQFVPEVMQATREISYTNYDDNTLVSFSVTGQDTVSSRLSNWLDMDGSVFPGSFTNEAVILGSSTANEWWKTSQSCLGPRNNLYICPKRGDGTASVYFGYDPAMEQRIGSDANNCPNGEGLCPVIGQVTHFGRAFGTGIKIAQNPKITGPILSQGGGWHVRFDQGTPKSLKIQYVVVHPNDLLLVAIPYPAGTTFQVVATDTNSCQSCQDVLVQVNSLEEVRQGFGDRYYYSNGLLYFRIVQRNSITNGAHVTWTKQTLDQVASFTREGITLMVMDQWSFTIEIKASNCGGSGLYCAVAPAAVPGRTEPPASVSTWAPTKPTPGPTRMPTRDCVGVWDSCAGYEWEGCCLGENVECVYHDQYWSMCEPMTGTKSPTKLPTKTPTKLPSVQPTKTPAVQTTSAPFVQTTSAPFVQSTGIPTKTPTVRPTGTPTKTPTGTPTKAPTPKATTTPTKPPSPAVSKAPTATKMPTKAVTKTPTKMPTKAVTKMPTKAVTKMPTKAVTKIPTKKPTKAPTKMPTKAVTKTPTKKPTKAPTSKQPTKMPTKKPTKQPTNRPTKKPTKQPTNRPTKKPIAKQG